MSVRDQLNAIAKERIIIMDGAMGSTIQALQLKEENFRGKRFSSHPAPLKGCNDLLCLTMPDVISGIHEAYLEAGADIIETCSFNSTSISLADYGLENLAYEISAAEASVARKSADKYSSSGKPRFVAGSIGPTARGASLYPDINDPSRRSILWDELEAAYYDNARGLLDGGADILIVETVFDTLNAKAALFAISRLLKERNIDVPVMVSATVSGDLLSSTNPSSSSNPSSFSKPRGKLLSGQSLDAFYASVRHINPWAVGLNCSLNAEKLKPFVRALSEIADCYVCACPNAGLPDQLGYYEETPDNMSANIEEYFKEGLVNIIGGCCGSAPPHIIEIAKKAASYKPRTLPTCKYSQHTFFCGLEPLFIQDNTIQFSETADEFLSLSGRGEYEDAVDAARDMIDNGETIVNVKTNNKETLSGFLDFALMNPYVAKVPFLLTVLIWKLYRPV
uniref:Methionine synthase n=1 Tax=uncultured bacterium contig00004 TaxID=1181496 RepID=A0A806KJE4_9BACT|nr:5-methyltetrahydrofolate--homocysteine methyltransferase [uncultured bacterium contig00004]